MTSFLVPLICVLVQGDDVAVVCSPVFERGALVQYSSPYQYEMEAELVDKKTMATPVCMSAERINTMIAKAAGNR